MKLITLLYLFVLGLSLQAQNTVGIIQQQPESVYEGYNLVFPHNQSNVFLLDNCGQIVHTWSGEITDRPGNAVYLLENGNLVKCKRKSTSGPGSPIWAGGAGETVEVLTWENELLHSFTLNDTSYRLHHDVEPLPNGNILMIAWESFDREAAIAAGRDTALLAQDKVWSEVILEWNPELDSIIWEWHAWDHLVQDYDATKANFGTIAAALGRIDLNYDVVNGNPDWLHINAIDYNPVLDQIVLSVPHFDELWIIDHNLTTAEAATGSGDLLYRWGNPQAYNSGTADAQQLFFQHDVQWLNPTAQIGDSDFGVISLFNNRLPDGTSSGNLLETTTNGSYSFATVSYLPLDFDRTIIHPEQDERAFSPGLSSAQFLPNGNALLLSGRWGFAYELTPENEVVWEYIVPLKAGRAVRQGEVLSSNDNITFRMTRYGVDYPAFEGRDLSETTYWEVDPNEAFCGVVSTVAVEKEDAFSVFPNPIVDRVTIRSNESTTFHIFNVQGQLIEVIELNSGTHELDVSDWVAGVYFLKDVDGGVRKLVVQ
jgi:hypothetical protein